MAGNRTVKVVIAGDSSGASKALQTLDSASTKSALNAAGAATKIGSTLGSIGSKLGGEFAELGANLGEVFSSIGEDGAKMGTKISAAGAAVTGVGVLLTAMGAKDKQANDQLKQSIEDTGNSYDDYEKQIEKTIGTQENFGHSAVDTQQALQKITQATGDPNKALAQMGVVANLAAAGHTSLSDAADKVDKILSGKGGKTLAQYGITMATTGDKTKNAQAALDQLSQKIAGQASASMDNWGAKVDVVKVKLEDWAAKIGEQVGPAITAIGPVLMATGAAMDLYAGHTEKLRAAQAALALTSEDSGVRVGASAVAASAVGIASDDAAAASTLALSATVSESTATQLSLFTSVAGGAQAASDTAIGADTAAEESTNSLAVAVHGSTASQLADFGAISSGSQAMAGEVGAAVATTEAEVEAVGEASTFALGPIGIALGGVALAAGAATLAYHLFGGGAKEAAKPVADLTAAIEADNDTLDANSQKVINTSLQHEGLVKTATAAGVSIGTLTQAGLENSDAMKQITDTQKSLDAITAIHTVTVGRSVSVTEGGTKAQQAQRAALDSLVDGLKKLDASTDASMAAATETNKVTAQSGFILDTTSKAYQAATTYASAYAKALDELDNKTLDAAKSEDQYLDSLDSVTAAVKQNGTSLDDNTTKGRANREALMNSIGTLGDVAKSQIAAGASVTTVNKTLQTNEDKLTASAAAAGLNKAQVKAMIAQMALTPAKIQTQIIVDDTAAFTALTNVEDKLNYLGGLANKDQSAFLTIASHVGTNISGGGSADADRQIALAPHKAAGGTSGGGWTVVGETGWEMVNMPANANVLTHGQSMAMAGSSRGSDGSSSGDFSQPLILQMVTPDGAVTHQQLLKLKRERGVTSLGLG